MTALRVTCLGYRRKYPENIVGGSQLGRAVRAAVSRLNLRVNDLRGPEPASRFHSGEI
jgi:hypothetical protein